MSAGRIAVLCLADVPDGPILGRNARNVLVALRTPEPGFLYGYHLDRLAWVDELVAKHGIRRALTVADLKAAHAAGQPAIIVDIDEMVRTDFQTSDSNAIYDRLDALVGSTAGQTDFATHYREILQRDVNVAMAHAAVRQTLLRLGRSGAADHSQKENQNHGTDKSGDQ